jgi:hypothetical protein
MMSRKGMEDINGPLDEIHEGTIVSSGGTQRLGLLPKDIEDGLDRFAGYEPAEDLMLDQVGPCLTLEFIQSGFKEHSQLWRGMDRHGDEGRCVVVGNRWREGGRNNTPPRYTRPWEY